MNGIFFFQADGESSWDPMRAEYQSVLNFGFSNRYLTSALVFGGVEAEGEYSSIHQVPCEFNVNGKCFKGRYCVKFHPIGNNASVFTVGNFSISHLTLLLALLLLISRRSSASPSKTCRS